MERGEVGTSFQKIGSKTTNKHSLVEKQINSID